ncbi:MAG: Ycf66 family protein [Cyanophyceae cyanobacterium]
MLTYILAIAVGLISFAFYMAAFFFPEVHRKDDFLWSGVGMFYALVLWMCAGRITGGVLLGQLAGVALLVWFGWETLTLRRLVARPETMTDIDESFSLTETLQKAFGQVGSLLRRQAPEPKSTAQSGATASSETSPKPSPAEGTPPTEPDETSRSVTAASASNPADTVAKATEEPEPSPAEVTRAQLEAEAAQASLAQPESKASATETAAVPRKRFSLKQLFSRGTSSPSQLKSASTVPPASSTPEMGEAVLEDSPSQAASSSADTVETAPQEAVSPNSDERQATPPDPPAPEMVEAAQEGDHAPQIDVEEVAPEAQLTPPAEPIGDGDPQMRQDIPELHSKDDQDSAT